MLRIAAHCLVSLTVTLMPTMASSAPPGLVGYWKLRGDCRDHSGHENHGVTHGADVETGTFDGRAAFVEIPDSASLQFAKGDFSCSAEIYTAEGVDDVHGDLISKFDRERRRGFNFTLVSNTSGYNAESDQRQPPPG